MRRTRILSQSIFHWARPGAGGLLLCGAAAFCLSCATAPKAEGGSGPSAADWQAFDDAFVGAICERVVTCQTTFKKGWQWSQAQSCDALFRSDGGHGDPTAALLAGRQVLNADRAAQCLDTIKALQCGEVEQSITHLPTVCKDVLEPAVPEGGPCVDGDDCVAGYCATDLNADKTCGGVCMKSLAKGQGCDEGGTKLCAAGQAGCHVAGQLCAPGLTCAASMTCETPANPTTPATLGQPCEKIGCVSGLHCVSKAGGQDDMVCAAPAGLGEPCGSGPPCAKGLLCEDAADPTKPGLQTCVAPHGLGEACDAKARMSTDRPPCKPGLICSPPFGVTKNSPSGSAQWRNGTCMEARKLGQPCEGSGQCVATDLYCKGEAGPGVCSPLPGGGAPCADTLSLPCAVGAVCVPAGNAKDPYDGVCTVIEDGAPCSGNGCGLALVCNQGKCMGQPGHGEACVDNDQGGDNCRKGLRCVDGACAPMCVVP